MTNSTNSLNRILVCLATIADVSGVCALSAQLFRKDLFLVLTTVSVLIVFGLLLWKIFENGWVDRRNITVPLIIFLASIMFAVMSWVWLSNVRVNPVNIAIIEPKDMTQIEGNRYLVKGTMSDSNAKVFVVVRPLESSDYWVQDPPTIDGNGNWQVNAYFGERNAVIGEKHEIIALATQENFLVTWLTGNYLSIGKRQDLPSNTNRSNIVNVSRMR